MEQSIDRILTTHVGSLPRAKRLSELLIQHEDGQDVDLGELDRLAGEGVRDVVARQVRALCAEGERRLVETLAEEIAGKILADHDVAEVEVEAKKFILPDCDYVSVKIRRARSDSK